MGLTAKEENEDFERKMVPAGIHHAICYGVIDEGSHFYEKRGKWMHKIRLMFEFPDHRIIIKKEGEDAQDLPMGRSNQYTLSLYSTSYLRRDLQSWRGKPFTKEELKGFEVRNVLGANCSVQIMHEEGNNGKIYDNITNIFPLTKGERRDSENPAVFFSFEDETPIIPERLPEWIVKIIKESREWEDLHPTSMPEPQNENNHLELKREEGMPDDDDPRDYEENDAPPPWAESGLPTSVDTDEIPL